MNSIRSVTAILFIMIFSIWGSIELRDYACDDAYIHLRIANNFAAGHGPYYNKGEKVMATSSFVWTCLLALIIRIGLDPLTFLTFLCPVLMVSGLVVWLKLLDKIQSPAPWIICPIFGLYYIAVMFPVTVGFMETPLAMLLLGGGLLLLISDRRSGWVFLVLALFTRLELAVFIPLMGCIKLFEKNFKWIDLLFLSIPVGIILAALLSFFGVISPNTVNAKSIVYGIPRLDVLHDVLRVLLPRVKTKFIVLFVLLLVGSGWSLNIKQNKTALMLMLGGMAIASAYIVKNVLLFSWYVPLFTIPFVLGILAAVSRSKQWIPLSLVILLCISPLKVFEKYVTSCANSDRKIFQEAAPGARVQRYLEVGHLLSQLYPDSTLLTSEIGGLGYTFPGRILDGAGLVTPEALQYHPLKVPEQRSSHRLGAIPADFIDLTKPDIIVSYSIFIQEFMQSSYTSSYACINVPAFSEKFEHEVRRNNIWGSKELMIYIRSDIVSARRIEQIRNILDWKDKRL